MALDVNALVDAVSRSLTTREKHGVTARVVTLERRFPASRAACWRALTDRTVIGTWFLPISGDLALGGRYQLAGNAGGQILECERRTRYAVTWEMEAQRSWVSVTLADAPREGTIVRLEHVAHVAREFWVQYGPGAMGVGWDQAFLGLDQHFATEREIDPDTAEHWIGTDEGKAFIERSSEAWGRVSIAAGTDPALARSAARRTTEFYTGVSAPGR